MKKSLILLLVFLLIPITVIFGSEGSKTNLVLLGSIGTQDSFANVDGGIKLGMDYKIDDEKDIFVRTLYSQFKFGHDKTKVKSLQTALYTNYFIGKRWTLTLMIGMENYTSGEFNGSDGFVGLGGKRILWTFNSYAMNVPATLSFIGEITFIDLEEESITNNAMQINLGLTFNPGIK